MRNELEEGLVSFDDLGSYSGRVACESFASPNDWEPNPTCATLCIAIFWVAWEAGGASLPVLGFGTGEMAVIVLTATGTGFQHWADFGSTP